MGVTSITPAGVEPHDFEPSPKDVSTIMKSDIFVWHGGSVDTWAQSLAKTRLEANLAVIQTSKNVELLPLSESAEDKKVIDPHTWLDPVLFSKEVQTVRDEFILADPTNADLYLKNAATLITELSRLDAEFSRGLQTCNDRRIVTSHNAFGYLAKRYDLTVSPIAGLSPEEEPSAGGLAELTDYVKSHKISTIFFETLASPKLAQTLAKETGAKTAVLNPLEGLEGKRISKGDDYFTVMRENLSVLRSALRCS